MPILFGIGTLQRLEPNLPTLCHLGENSLISILVAPGRKKEGAARVACAAEFHRLGGNAAADPFGEKIKYRQNVVLVLVAQSVAGG